MLNLMLLIVAIIIQIANAEVRDHVSIGKTK